MRSKLFLKICSVALALALLFTSVSAAQIVRVYADEETEVEEIQEPVSEPEPEPEPEPQPEP